MVPAGPTDEELLAAAGSARYSRLLVRGEFAGLALAVVDANGDGALFETVTLAWHDGAWRECASGSAGVLAEGWTGGVAYAYGRTPDADGVEVALRGQPRRVPVNRDGWWLILAAAQEHERFDLAGVPGHSVRSRHTDGPPRIAG